MTEINAQLTLQTWMSAAFPTGSFTCSHGLESAIADQRLHDAHTVQQWIASIIRQGSGWNDAVLLVSAYQSIQRGVQENPPDYAALNASNDLALALCTGAERFKETTQLGYAFFKAASTSSSSIPMMAELVDDEIALPIAIGACGAFARIPLEWLLPASIQASSSNLVWICTRLVPLGQNQALKIIANLQSMISDCAQQALTSSVDELGSCTLLADLASIEHEELHSRICIT